MVLPVRVGKAGLTSGEIPECFPQSSMSYGGHCMLGTVLGWDRLGG